MLLKTKAMELRVQKIEADFKELAKRVDELTKDVQRTHYILQRTPKDKKKTKIKAIVATANFEGFEERWTFFLEGREGVLPCEKTTRPRRKHLLQPSEGIR